MQAGGPSGNGSYYGFHGVAHEVLYKCHQVPITSVQASVHTCLSPATKRTFPAYTAIDALPIEYLAAPYIHPGPRMHTVHVPS